MDRPEYVQAADAIDEDIESLKAIDKFKPSAELLATEAAKEGLGVIVLFEATDEKTKMSRMFHYESKNFKSCHGSMISELIKNWDYYLPVIHGMMTGRIRFIDPEFTPKITNH